MTAAHRPTTPPDHIRWPLWWLWLLLYPFVALAAWIDLFMIGLLATWIGLPNLSPFNAFLVSLVVALPAAYGTALWLRSLLRRAEAP